MVFVGPMPSGCPFHRRPCALRSSYPDAAPWFPEEEETPGDGQVKFRVGFPHPNLVIPTGVIEYHPTQFF